MDIASLEHIPESLGRKLHRNHMEALGIENTMRLAHASNRIIHAREDEWRHRFFRENLEELLAYLAAWTQTPPAANP